MHKIIGFSLFFVAVVALSQKTSPIVNCRSDNSAACGVSLKSSSYVWSLTNGSGVSGDLSSFGSDKILKFTSCPPGLGVGGFVYISGENLSAESAPIDEA